MSNKKATIKRIFIFFLCYLPVQYGLVGIFGYYKAEPWPAFVFPGFKNVYVYNGQYAVNNFYLEISHKDYEEPSVLSLQSFFDDIPPSKIPGFMRSNISDQQHIRDFSQETIQWLDERANNKTGYLTEQIQLVHERKFMQRKDGDLTQDSTLVISRLQLFVGNRVNE